MNEKKSRREFIKEAALTAAVLTASSSLTANAATTSASAPNASDEKRSDEKPLEIAILLYDKMTALDAVGPYEVLSRLPNTVVKFVGETKGLKTAETKMLSLQADYTLDEVPKPDILLIPGGGDTRETRGSKKVMDWIINAHKTTRYTVSICTGALFLGAAGLLKGEKATTHWAVKGMLADMYGAEYVATRYVQSGKILTSAGVSAGIDAALYLAEQLTDKKTAQIIQLWTEYDPQPPFKTVSFKNADPELVEATRNYIAEIRKSRGDVSPPLDHKM